MQARDVVLTDHAAERFAERVRPGLSRRAAVEELRRLLAVGEVVTERPAWLFCQEPETVAFVLLGDAVALPVARAESNGALVATTVLVRGGMSDQVRERRRARKAARRQRAKLRAALKAKPSSRRRDALPVS